MKINVINIEQLYAAVNNPANAGNKIVMAPGLYTLDNFNRPNAGRLELLEDMELSGQARDAGKVTIDASALPDASFNPPLGVPAARTGAIRMGKGSNKIEWIKVIGNASGQALSVIDTDIIWAGGTSRVRIANSIITKGRIGIDIRNVGAASAGRIIEAEIIDNEITDNLVSDPGTQQGQGIVIQNANGAAGGVIRVTLKGNNVHGNITGLRSFNNNAANNTKTDKASITIQSHGDKFDQNKMGITLTGGLNKGVNATVNENFISFKAQDTSIQNNQGILPDPISFPCGILISGATSLAAGSQASDNNIEMKLKDCNISGNEGSDIIVYGALSTTPNLAGTNNIVDIQLTGLTKKTTIAATPSSPLEPAATNIINIGK